MGSQLENAPSRSLERNITVGFASALLLLLVISIVAFQSLRQFISNNGWEEHTRQVLVVIADATSDMKEAEAAARGYVISDDHSYLLASQAAADRARIEVRELRRLTADNSRQQQRLDRLEPLVADELKLIAGIAKVRQEEGSTEAGRLAVGQGERLTQELQLGLGQMRHEENELLRVRSAAAVVSAKATMGVISCGGAVAVALVVLAGWLIRRDILSRRRAEEELNRFFTLSLDLLCIAGADGHFKRVSSAWTNTLGYSEKEMLTTPYLDLIHPDDRAATSTETTKLEGGSKTLNFENRYRCKDGSYRWLLWTAAPADGGRVIYGAARDITDRKQTEAALRLAEERFRLMIDAIRDYAIFMLDPTGHVAGWNPAAERIKGYRADEIVGQHFSRFYTNEDLEAGKPQRELQVATQNGRCEEEGWRVRKDGSKFWANVIISTVRDDAGTLRGFAKVTRDVTERKRAEDHIKKLNAALQAHASRLEATNKELEAFCYSVSHDLRAPLRSIDGFSVALLEDYGDKLEPEAQDYLKRVRAATQRMAQLIDDLLNLSRLSRAEITRTHVNLSELARAVESELRARDPSRQVEMVIGDGLTAEGDARLLRVVLDNLIGNAWKFTSKQSDARIEFGTEGENGTRRFFIRDNGAGFDMAYVHKLFGAFQRLHANSEYSGTGVGLATVQRIIHRHGGRISAEGELNKGATFHFTL